MSRYIDADLMQEKAYQMNFGRRINERELFLFNRALSEMPTVDAVPVVRCKDCVHYNNERSMYDDDYCGILYYCDGTHRTVCEQDFCSYGKRKEK